MCVRVQSAGHKAPKQIITDPEELAEYRLRTRKYYEDMCRRVGRFQHNIWTKVCAVLCVLCSCALVCVQARVRPRALHAAVVK